ncbi:AraC family transcriptional regulator [Shouchella clausii]|uniref:AraC family transcriptional regulator n=1 Tax=Shouchella clausii TaxID=79880 RepID=A0A268P0K2_SHOCL|nr:MULTISPECIES: AraC family transcriptional regulator [Shouchella]ALA53827.1 Transcriptional regulator, AraC family [Shouchella clausii]MBU3229608.1 AraC family transcriptional regulator [Shouchella clausii]MBU3265169.1 AraC family transcriptional regulator [Shouchella clausii]MBU3506509.1 AraC family transcriptional regulator [Shouchella clausii]MBU3533628.1 AraC family transcriptional regulator [Shouchella clausii]
MSGALVQTPTLNFNYKEDHKNERTLSFHSHEQAEIFYFHEGKCTYLIGDQIFSLAPGDIILMNGLTLHCPKLYHGHPYVRSTIHFDHRFFQEVFQALGDDHALLPFAQVKPVRLSFTGGSRQQLEQHLAQLHDSQKRGGPMAAPRFQLAFMDLLLYLCSYWGTSQNELPKGEMSQKEKTVQAVVSFIESHYHEHLGLETIEEALHVSKYHLSKVFKEMTGVTIFKYLYQRRVNQAKIELLVSDASITDICYQVGFHYPSHFTKVFKQFTGITPAQYKRQSMSG